MTRETAANTFCSCFARKNYAAQELPTYVWQFVPFSLKPAMDDSQKVCETCSQHENMREMKRV